MDAQNSGPLDTIYRPLAAIASARNYKSRERDVHVSGRCLGWTLTVGDKGRYEAKYEGPPMPLKGVVRRLGNVICACRHQWLTRWPPKGQQSFENIKPLERYLPREPSPPTHFASHRSVPSSTFAPLTILHRCSPVDLPDSTSTIFLGCITMVIVMTSASTGPIGMSLAQANPTRGWMFGET